MGFFFRNMEYKTITFYKFLRLSKPHELCGYLRGLCEALDLKGRILVGVEGINAGISGKRENVEIFKKKFTKNIKFCDLTFREYEAETNSYHKLVVKVRDEIVALGEKVDINKSAEYVSPKRLKKWYEKNDDFVIIDMRNSYEAEIGKFKGAKVLPIKNFRELPKELEKMDDLKDKKIVVYCTGGIRCEKLTPLMKEKGFNNVFQLRGGIINYVKEFPGQEFEGDLFVFDDRLVSKTGSKEKLGNCLICDKKTNKCTDCYNLDCDRLFVCCGECRIEMNNSCSKICKDAPRRRDVEVLVN